MKASSQDGLPGSVAQGSEWRAWALLGLLFVAYILSLMDRMILALLVTPIKADLQLSDTQIGLLQGLAFVLFYSVLGLPIGRLVDRFSRTRIIAAGIALWSLATAFCGTAGHYWQLFIGRISVGVGEATLSPASYSLIADSFPPRRLGIATSLFAFGAAAGSGIALIIGGTVVQWTEAHGTISLLGLVDLAPWQQVFMLVGLPGVLLATMFLIVREPARPSDTKAIPNWIEISAYLRTNGRWIIFHFAAVGSAALVLYASISWIVAYLERSFAWSVATAGTATGTVNVVGSAAGLVIGGILSDRMRRKSNAHRLLICAFALAFSTAFGIAFPLADDPYWAVVLWGGVMTLAGVPIGVAGANLQEQVPSRMRGVVSAIYFFCVNAVGAGLGPVLVPLIAGQINDGSGGLAPALAVVTGTASALSAALFLFAFREQRRFATTNL